MYVVLEEVINKLKDVKFKCSCGYRFHLSNPERYLHDGGLLSSDGKKYWLYYVCPKCGYQWAYWKIIKKVSV